MRDDDGQNPRAGKEKNRSSARSFAEGFSQNVTRLREHRVIDGEQTALLFPGAVGDSALDTSVKFRFRKKRNMRASNISVIRARNTCATLSPV